MDVFRRFSADVEIPIQEAEVKSCGEDGKYSVFSRHEKSCIVAMVSYAAWFSTVSSFIYLPAANLLSQEFSVSADQILLTVTSFIAVATVAPTLVGDAADILGRRPAYFVTLGLFVVANICIALARTYREFLGLRVLQALGISGVIAIGYGVITDVATPSERGSFVSIFSFAVSIAPSFGPILGCAISHLGGWRWIFWFLTISSGLCLTIIVFFLPETSRNIVGDGSIQPAAHLRLPISIFVGHWKDDESGLPRSAGHTPNPLKSFKILIRKDNAVVLVACGLMYAVHTCLTTNMATLFTEIYGLNGWQAGLIYIPLGLGGTLSMVFSGPLLDRSYADARTTRGLSTNKVEGDDLDDFPVEKARLGVIWIPMLTTTLIVVGYGWVLHYEKHIAIPLVLQFMLGLALQLDFSAFNTLLVDTNSRSPAAASASSSLVRCSLAAVGISYLDNMIGALGVGWTFTAMGTLCLVVLGLFTINYHNGMAWRQEALYTDVKT